MTQGAAGCLAGNLLTNGCSQQNLVSTGGAGLLYCFAAQ